jgi:poly-gamma-glutamate capsule biosynthesis protein CapA/YwtB (metallophosphatase superfamily)/lysophospholipase L1-like esterase
MSKKKSRGKSKKRSSGVISRMMIKYENNRLDVKRLITILIISIFVFMPSADSMLPHVVAGTDADKAAKVKVQNDKTQQTVIQAKDQIVNIEGISGSSGKVMNKERKAAFDQAVKITFCGDIMLLKDQIEKAYNGENYNFDYIFKYTRDYIEDADLAIGVMEGTFDGKNAGYSTGTFEDKNDVCLNYPDDFATSLKKAGFDMVTTATDHFMDKDIEGVHRTISILDSKQIDHVGTYRNQEEKDKIKIVEVKGLKIAVLAYTYCVNDKDKQAQLKGSDAFLTSIIVDPQSPDFNRVKENVRADFDKAKELNPDLIIVLPHMGTQFTHDTNSFQKAWNDLFIQYGADIVFGDHVQTVQPIEYVNKADTADKIQKNAVIVNSAGNFFNIYRQKDCDASAMVEVYVDRLSKDILGTSIVPMWIQNTPDGKCQTIPIYTLMTYENMLNTINTYDRERISQVQELVTKIMMGESMGIEMVNRRYYITPEGYVKDKVASLTLTDKEMISGFYSLLTTHRNVCFVGDSITAGTKNGGYGWFEPLSFLVSGNISKKAIGGSTTKTILGSIKNEGISCADLYVVAIGTNDIRYLKSETCSTTTLEYITNISDIVQEIKKNAPNAEFAFIAPWMTLNSDTHCTSTIDVIKRLYLSFSVQLKEYCETNGFTYIDPNSYIKSVLDVQSADKYLVDYIHPNAKEGIKLYSMAVLSASINQQQ